MERRRGERASGRPRIWSRGRGLTLAALCALAPFGAWAADWTLTRQLSLEGGYSDNLDLAAEDPEGGFYAELTPGLVLNARGGRLDLDLAYALQYLDYFATDSASGDVNHRLRGEARAELWRERLFLDATVSARQELIDPFGPSSGDAINPSGNRQTSYTYLVAPTLRHAFGRQADLNLRLDHNGLFYSDTGEDSLGYGGSFELLSGPAFGALFWALAGRQERIDYLDASKSARYGSAQGTLGYRFDRRLRLSASLGYDDNDYSALDDTSGAFWQGELLWTPDSRTALRLGAGERYFGWTPFLDFSHGGKHSLWRASFVRNISTPRRDRLEAPPVYAFEDAFGEPLIPDTGEASEILAGEAAASAETYVNNALRASWTLDRRRGLYGAALGYVLREYEASAREEEERRVRLFWTRRLTPLSSSRLALGWEQLERRDAIGLEDIDANESLTFDAALSRRLSPHAWIELQYHLREGEDYTENRLMLGLRASWSD